MHEDTPARAGRVSARENDLGRIAEANAGASCVELRAATCWGRGAVRRDAPGAARAAKAARCGVLACRRPGEDTTADAVGAHPLPRRDGLAAADRRLGGPLWRRGRSGRRGRGQQRAARPAPPPPFSPAGGGACRACSSSTARDRACARVRAASAPHARRSSARSAVRRSGGRWRCRCRAPVWRGLRRAYGVEAEYLPYPLPELPPRQRRCPRPRRGRRCAWCGSAGWRRRRTRCRRCRRSTRLAARRGPSRSTSTATGRCAPGSRRSPHSGRG